jgi:hypothetical protein
MRMETAGDCRVACGLAAEVPHPDATGATSMVRRLSAMLKV